MNYEAKLQIIFKVGNRKNVTYKLVNFLSLFFLPVLPRQTLRQVLSHYQCAAADIRGGLVPQIASASRPYLGLRICRPFGTKDRGSLLDIIGRDAIL